MIRPTNHSHAPQMPKPAISPLSTSASASAIKAGYVSRKLAEARSARPASAPLGFNPSSRGPAFHEAPSSFVAVIACNKICTMSRTTLQPINGSRGEAEKIVGSIARSFNYSPADESTGEYNRLIRDREPDAPDLQGFP